MTLPVLNPAEARVLGALIEKDLATPDYYPLSLNALVNACNQKTNRDPVMSLDEESVAAALDSLRYKDLVRENPGEGRVAKYAHRASETLALGNPQLAVMCVLLLRGPQTPGELRTRTQSLRSFDDLESVEACLRRLMERPEPFVARLPRQPGTKEHRYAHLLSGEIASFPEPQPVQPDRLTRLEVAVEALTREVEDVKRELAQLRDRQS